MVADGPSVRTDCAAAIVADAEAALDDAARWISLGGGAKARLCEAAALEAVGAFAVAASRLTELGQEKGVALSAEARAIILTDAAALWLEAGSPELADVTVGAALTLKGTTPRRSRILARALGQQARWDEAEAILSSHLADMPDDAIALTLMAATKRRLGKADDALQSAEAAIGINPDLPEARFEAAAAMYAQQDWEKARPALLEFLAAYPDHSLAEPARSLLLDQPR